MERSPQRPESAERQAPISYEDFMQFLVDLDHKGEEPPPTSQEHAFYQWATQYYEKARDIDGATLEELYRTNVLEKNPPMTEGEFAAYCEKIGMPYYNAGTSKFVVSFEVDQKHSADTYEAWAHERGTETTPGSIMRFTDESGNKVRMYTETARRGQTVDSPGYRPDGIQDPSHDSEE